MPACRSYPCLPTVMAVILVDIRTFCTGARCLLPLDKLGRIMISFDDVRKKRNFLSFFHMYPIWLVFGWWCDAYIRIFFPSIILIYVLSLTDSSLLFPPSRIYILCSDGLRPSSSSLSSSSWLPWGLYFSSGNSFLRRTTKAVEALISSRNGNIYYIFSPFLPHFPAPFLRPDTRICVCVKQHECWGGRIERWWWHENT